jgi:hypothetical protein
MHSMTTERAPFLDLVKTSFPVEPLPSNFFRPEGIASLDLDIPQELRNRISGRPWTNLTLLDWRMIGASPIVARRYLEPATFMYYVPSLLVGASQEIEFIQFALEAIIPDNEIHVPRGEWWFEFSGIATPPQRAALAAFLAHVRRTSWDTIGSQNQYLLERSETVWPS